MTFIKYLLKPKNAVIFQKVTTFYYRYWIPWPLRESSWPWTGLQWVPWLRPLCWRTSRHARQTCWTESRPPRSREWSQGCRKTYLEKIKTIKVYSVLRWQTFVSTLFSTILGWSYRALQRRALQCKLKTTRPTLSQPWRIRKQTFADFLTVRLSSCEKAGREKLITFFFSFFFERQRVSIIQVHPCVNTICSNGVRKKIRGLQFRKLCN